MKLGFVIACAIVVGLPGPARAGDPDPEEAAVRRVLDAQVAALAKGDGKALAALFVDAPAVLLPSSTDVAVDAEDLIAAVAAWKPTAVAIVGTPVIDLRSMNGSIESWVAAELEVTAGGVKTAARLTELVHVAVEAPGGDHKTPVNKAVAMMISVPVPDKALVGAAKVKTYTGATFAEFVVAPAKQRFINYDRTSVVIGTAPGEHAYGNDAAKLLEKWKRLKLADIDTSASELQGLGYVIGHVSLSRGKKKPPVTLDAFAIVLRDMDQLEGEIWQLVSLHYGAHSQTK